MTGLLKWCSDPRYREQCSLERWERERAQGKLRFVLRNAMIFPVTMTVIRDFNGYFFDGAVPEFHLRSLAIYSLIGFVAAFFGWSSREGKYKRALLNRRRSFSG